MFELEKLRSTKWHNQEAEAVLDILQVDQKNGLNKSEADQRLELFGPNQIIDQGGRSIWSMIISQFADTMVLVLLAAAVISAVISGWKDAIAIAAIVLINAVIGLVQEYRAEQAMAALKQLASPYVRVKRDGKFEDIDAQYLVPGDIIFLEAGSKIPADARLFESASLRVE